MTYFILSNMCHARGGTTKIRLGGGGLLFGSIASHLKTHFETKLFRITEQLNGFLFIFNKLLAVCRLLENLSL